VKEVVGKGTAARGAGAVEHAGEPSRRGGVVVVVSQWDRLGGLTEMLEEVGWREAKPDRQESRDQRPLHPRR
jgi:hypothetical protein